jgi:hypothetical protein
MLRHKNSLPKVHHDAVFGSDETHPFFCHDNEFHIHVIPIQMKERMKKNTKKKMVMIKKRTFFYAFEEA